MRPRDGTDEKTAMSFACTKLKEAFGNAHCSLISPLAHLTADTLADAYVQLASHNNRLKQGQTTMIAKLRRGHAEFKAENAELKAENAELKDKLKATEGECWVCVSVSGIAD